MDEQKALACDVVDYDNFRTEINHGDILLCSGTSFISELIKKATGSIWSHVGIVLKIEAIDRIVVVESVESVGVRTIALSSYCKDYNGTGEAYPGGIMIARHAAFPADQQFIHAMAAFGVDLFGYPYDKQEIARIATRIATGGLFGSERTPDDKVYICSEFVEAMLARVGIVCARNALGFVAPSDIAADPQVHPKFWLNTKWSKPS